MRAKAAEKMLLGLKLAEIEADLVAEASRLAASETRPITDLRASADYRREISRVLVKRCIEESVQKLRDT